MSDPRKRNIPKVMAFKSSPISKTINNEDLSLDEKLNMLRSLLKTEDVSKPDDYDGLTPLYNAIFIKEIEIVKLLLENGADVNGFSDSRWTPVNLPIVKLLLENDAKTNEKDFMDYTPIDLALHCNNIELVKVLVENDAIIESHVIEKVRKAIGGMHWKKEIHHLYSKKTRNAIRAVSILKMRNHSLFGCLPMDVLLYLFSFMNTDF
jgi:ankyrin repeat protein